MSLSFGTCLGPYEITALIGEGGMGQVYRARDTKLDRDVAVKILYYLDPDQKVMAVPVKINGASLELGTPQVLFTATGASYLLGTRDGQRFLMNVPAGGESAAGPPLTIVTNWQAGLKK